ncbi:uncharacterized protein LOC118434383 [Folsomia candida]|uniref:Uncharacterized protein n=1 Tax=Folsomia candida TaxID=158441 RepID=A0A226EUY1_FOLCA|nr:uncharacterized protein LOC118434383 [Folsomia candida]OXA60874.1 hypothetical protein Fcan01_06359 [Folsomia candida]
MTASIIMKLELSNQLKLLHNHLIETSQLIEDFLETENGVDLDSSEGLNLKEALPKFVGQMSSFASNVISLQVKLNPYQEGDGDPKGYHDDVIESDKKPQQGTLIEAIRTNGYKFPAGYKVKTEELEMEAVVASEEEDEEDEDLLPNEMEEVEEGYDDEYSDEIGTSPPEYEYDMHPVQEEEPPNSIGRRKQILQIRNIDETPIVEKPKPVKNNIPPMWNGKPVSLSTLRVMRFRSRMTEEQKAEQRRKDRERVTRKRAALRAASALQQDDTNGNSNSSESYESLRMNKKKEDSP